MTKILFICHGNICRSVIAEMVMKERCRRAGVEELFEIASAAVSREEIGNDIYPPAKRKLREKGIPFTSHAARQITRADYAYYDYIICADRSNLRWLERIIGEDTEHKVSLMMAWPKSQNSLANNRSSKARKEMSNLKSQMSNHKSPASADREKSQMTSPMSPIPGTRAISKRPIAISTSPAPPYCANYYPKP